jgi:hypothetical protein
MRRGDVEIAGVQALESVWLREERKLEFSRGSRRLVCTHVLIDHNKSDNCGAVACDSLGSTNER